MGRRARTSVPVYIEVRTGRIKEACARYSLGKDAMREIAEKAGAVIQLSSRLTLYDFVKIDAYLGSLAK